MNDSVHEAADPEGPDGVAYDSAVALVGMSGRFPGAADVGELWRNLLAGTGGLREITDAELSAAGIEPGPGYVRVGGPVAGLEGVDATAFGLTAREAETMEPHHRLLLECSWEALERAGYQPTDPGIPVGVFAGCAFPDYLTRNVPGLGAEPGGKQLLAAGVERDSLTSLVSYKLGLRGPSLTVQTYCSTSLVAVHLACQSLLTYECDMALAGGAFLPLPQPAGYLYEDGGILSPDGTVRSLDAGANGTVMGSGVAVVALKRLADALADGDRVHAVILGSAITNDGRDRAGYAAPGVAGQAAAIETALAVAGVKPETVGYVECHAVGTPLGDSIELAALKRVFTTPRETPCVLGSVKPSIGHLDRAAGVTGLLHAALSLGHRRLPATAGFRTPGPALAGAADRFTVLTADRPWPAGPGPRRAGVSSFGVGGTNAHVVLEEAPPQTVRPPRPGPHLLVFSAADPDGLGAVTRRLRDHLTAHPDEDLADIAYTLQLSRGHFALRRAVVVTDRRDAVAALADPGRWTDGETRRRDPRIRLTGEDDPELAGAARRLLGAGTLAAGLHRLGARLVEARTPEAVDLPVEPGPAAPGVRVLATLARLWLAGSPIDWAALHGGAGRRVELPPYPFRHRRHWIDPVRTGPAVPSTADQGTAAATAGPGAVLLPAWRRRPLPDGDPDRRLRMAGPWLLLVAEERGEALVRALVRAGAEVTAARPGSAFSAEASGDFTVSGPADLTALLNELTVVPRTVVHGLSLASPAGEGPGHHTAEQRRGGDSVAALEAALAADPVLSAIPPELTVLTSGALGVLGTDLTHPEHAALAAGPGRGRLDIDTASEPDVVLAAVTAGADGPLVLRGGELWTGHQESCRLAAAAPLTGATVLLVGDSPVAQRHLEAHGAVVPVVPADESAVREAADGRPGLHAVVLAAPTVADFHAVRAALGDTARERRVLLEPREAAGAHARASRVRGEARWLVAEGDGAADHIGRLLSSTGHLTEVVIPGGPVRAGVPEQVAAPAPAAPPAPVGAARPRRPRPALATAFIEPEAGLEGTVAGLWAVGLGMEAVGADDNFFDLGGRSAAAVQIAAKLGQTCGVALPLTALVEYPTVRLLTARIAELTAGWDGGGSAV